MNDDNGSRLFIDCVFLTDSGFRCFRCRCCFCSGSSSFGFAVTERFQFRLDHFKRKTEHRNIIEHTDERNTVGNKILPLNQADEGTNYRKNDLR